MVLMILVYILRVSSVGSTLYSFGLEILRVVSTGECIRPCGSSSGSTDGCLLACTCEFTMPRSQ